MKMHAIFFEFWLPFGSGDKHSKVHSMKMHAIFFEFWLPFGSGDTWTHQT
jgi:hypothetical protein